MRAWLSFSPWACLCVFYTYSTLFHYLPSLCEFFSAKLKSQDLVIDNWLGRIQFCHSVTRPQSLVRNQSLAASLCRLRPPNIRIARWNVHVRYGWSASANFLNLLVTALPKSLRIFHPDTSSHFVYSHSTAPLFLFYYITTHYFYFFI